MINKKYLVLFIVLIFGTTQLFAVGSQQIQTTSLNINTIKEYLGSANDDEIEGIYIQYNGSNPYLLAVIYDRIDECYLGVFLSGPGQPEWKEGYVKAVFNQVNSNTFNVTWHSRSGTTYKNIRTVFQNGRFSFTVPDLLGSHYIFSKIFPGSRDFARDRGATGTGFLLNNDGYVITNHHVIEGADHVLVRGINGDFSLAYSYAVVLFDEYNDIAILKPEVSSLRFDHPPYSFRTTNVPQGLSVFALGYPMRAAMGDEIKLTNGIISALSGYMGNPNMYQTTAPTNPGNSGGPLFDENGYIIGITTSSIRSLSSVHYAIKINYVIDLINNSNSAIALPPQRYLHFWNDSLVDITRNVRNYVYMIEVY